jgi:hypothetical protein
MVLGSMQEVLSLNILLEVPEAVQDMDLVPEV